MYPFHGPRQLAPTTAADLQSILGHELILPHDLLPDDTTLVYDDNGTPAYELDLNDPDSDSVIHAKNYARDSALALAYYNDKHGTDYKIVDTRERWGCYQTLMGNRVHCGFSAAPSTAMDCPSYFCSDLQVEVGGDVVVISCRNLDGLKTTDCGCFIAPWEPPEKYVISEDLVPPLSRYAHLLADGVTLSDKARSRVRDPLLALTYYNKKHHTDYKLVDALAWCYSVSNRNTNVFHINFLARKTAPDDASDKLFFAEIEHKDCSLLVTACRIVRGKTTAGCCNCSNRRGKRVIHPTHGFRDGIYPKFPYPKYPLRSLDRRRR